MIRRVIPILILILTLILRQAPVELKVDQLPGSSPIVQEINQVFDTPGFGWFENMEKENPKEIPPINHSCTPSGVGIKGRIK